MSDVTVKQFAEVLKVTPEKLLEQLAEAGVALEKASDIVSDDTKMILLQHLRKSHGRAENKGISSPKKITLKRKSQSGNIALMAHALGINALCIGHECHMH